ncbi:MAG TPA: glycosyltransferase family 2 protein, partial [Flavobacterium sp.]
MKLSIVIPVYNVENSLRKCVESALNNDLPLDDFEIIIIDDESPDNSLKIAEEFALANPNVRVISQENKGLGGARNTGIKAAAGDYLLFLDSDDYLSPGKLGSLMSEVKINAPEILEFGAAVVDLQGNHLKNIAIHAPGIYDGTEYWQKFPS